MHLEAVVRGEVYSESDFSIGKSGEFNGFLLAKHAIIGGTFHGQVCCEFLEVIDGALVDGHFCCKAICVDSGASFVGRVYASGDEAFYQVLTDEVVAAVKDFQSRQDRDVVSIGDRLLPQQSSTKEA